MKVGMETGDYTLSASRRVEVGDPPTDSPAPRARGVTASHRFDW